MKKNHKSLLKTLLVVVAFLFVLAIKGEMVSAATLTPNYTDTLYIVKGQSRKFTGTASKFVLGNSSGAFSATASQTSYTYNDLVTAKVATDSSNKAYITITADANSSSDEKYAVIYIYNKADATALYHKITVHVVSSKKITANKNDGTGATVDTIYAYYNTYGAPNVTDYYSKNAYYCMYSTLSTWNNKITTITVPGSRTGYTFAGYYSDTKGTTKNASSTGAISTSTATVKNGETWYAIWNPVEYTVTYNANGGSGSDQLQSVNYGATWTTKSSTAFSRTGYTLNSWNTAKDGSGVSYSLDTSQSAWSKTTGLTLYGIWKANQYSVTFVPSYGKLSGTEFGNYDGSSQDCTLKVTYNSSTNSTVGIVTRDESNYIFAGWYTSQDGGDMVYDANGKSVDGVYWQNGKWVSTKSVTLYAHWAANQYSVTFVPSDGKLSGTEFGNYNGSSQDCTLEVTYNTSTNSNVGTATRDNYTFAGWYTSQDGGDMVYDANGKSVDGVYWQNGKWISTKSVTLYAHWKANQYSVTFVPSYGKLSGTEFGNYNGSSQDCTLKVTYNSSTNSTVGTATRDESNYTFAGWYTSLDGGDMVYDANGKSVDGVYWQSGKWVSTKSVTLYAHWTMNEEKISATVISASNGKSGINLTWNAVDNASNYIVYRAVVNNGVTGSYSTVYSGTAKAYTDKSARYNVTYSYKVVCSGNGQNSANSNIVTVKHSMFKPVIRRIRVVKNNKKYILKINMKGSLYSGYKIFYRKKGTSKVKVLGNITQNKVNLQANKLKKGTYFIKIKGYAVVEGEHIYTTATKEKKIVCR